MVSNTVPAILVVQSRESLFSNQPLLSHPFRARTTTLILVNNLKLTHLKTYQPLSNCNLRKTTTKILEIQSSGLWI